MSKSIWVYKQSTGELFCNSVPAGKGYSGHGEGLNNPAMEGVHDVGPIPKGKYLVGAPYDSSKTGKYTLPLTPLDHNALGRTALKIHGDNSKGDMSASHGCIILSRNIRSTIWNNCEYIEVIE